MVTATVVVVVVVERKEKKKVKNSEEKRTRWGKKGGDRQCAKASRFSYRLPLAFCALLRPAPPLSLVPPPFTSPGIAASKRGTERARTLTGGSAESFAERKEGRDSSPFALASFNPRPRPRPALAPAPARGQSRKGTSSLAVDPRKSKGAQQQQQRRVVVVVVVVGGAIYLPRGR
ncbi:hypothetical protein NL676_017037 [Syzygium grande]|nr:hypothetical protein NL676_017037 [Syzygium grande]